MSKDIPAVACIEQQILSHAVSEGNLQSSVRRVEAEYGLETGSLGTGLILQVRILSLLYMLILFPKEYWKMGQDDPIYQEGSPCKVAIIHTVKLQSAAHLQRRQHLEFW